MSHTATLSHDKQELTNQRSLHSRDKVAQNRALLYSKRSCATVEKLRDAPCVLQFVGLLSITGMLFHICLVGPNPTFSSEQFLSSS